VYVRHVATLMRASVIVDDEPFVESGLHLLDRFEPGPAPLDAEMFVEHSAMKAFDDAVGLRPSDFGRLVLDLFELQEELVRMLVRPAAEFAPIVREHRLDHGLMGLEGRDDVAVERGGSVCLNSFVPNVKWFPALFMPRWKLSAAR
jgi:hypothetical protein